MSNIDCYVTQLADKCLKVINSCERTATQNDCEVTLLLMAASSGVIVPYERLNSNSKFNQPVNDHAHYPDDVEKMQALLKQPFIGSEVWKTENKTWKSGILTCLMKAKEEKPTLKDEWPHPGDWIEPKDAKLMGTTVTVGEVIECMRNALAHGNIYTDPDSANNIKMLVFATGTGIEGGISKKGKTIEANPFRFVSVSVPDFKMFLKNWFKWLKTFPMGVKFFPEQDEDYILPSAA